MIRRLALGLVKTLARQFPAVLLLGPRQCGKTTLARKFLRGTYLDLEKPSDQEVFLGDPELALRRLREPLILDEAQTLPTLFPVLRALIDDKRARNGRYYLLGSVSPVLVREISESLAGRVGILELTPFLYAETEGAPRSARGGAMDLPTLWLRGGFPDACREKRAERRQRWHEAYVRTFIERDLARHGLRTSPIQLRRFVGMLAHLHGGLFNASDVGRSLGVTYHTVQTYLDLLEGHFLTRRLQPYFPKVGKRLVKSPKIYLRDSGLLHYLLGIQDERGLLEWPRRGFSWEGFMIEQITALEALGRPASRFYFYRTYAGAEVDLIIDRGRERLGLQFKCASSAGPADARPLMTAIEEGILTRGFLVHLGSRRFPVAKKIEAIGAHDLLLSALA